MIKKLLSALFILPLCFGASAQLRYAFKDTFSVYVPLVGATSVNGTTIWDDETYNTPLPFPWRIDRDVKISNLNLILALPGISTGTDKSDMSGFFLGDMDMADRGNIDRSASKSPIRYLVTGTAPYRIFKLEFANAGFADELSNFHTMNDSFNMQVWVYETSNIVEYHFGPSWVDHYDYYALGGSGPFMGFMKHIDFNSGNSGTFYYVTDYGTMDSLIIPGFAPVDQLYDWPFNRQVFRFTPTWTSCDKPSASFGAGTVSGFSASYTYYGTEINLDSLVWNFGDGTTQRVSNSFSTPVMHNYTTAGHYAVSVIAYSDCGNDTSQSQKNAVAVNNIGNNDQLNVYPNPATGILYIDGAEHTGLAIVLSPLGQVVLRRTIGRGKNQLDISNIPAGPYTLILSDEHGTIGNTRFVKL